MRADEAPISAKEKLALPKAKSVKFSNQVEYKEIETNVAVKQSQVKLTQVFNKPERRLSMPENNTVKARLGVKNEKINLTKNIFNRLGV